MFNDKIKLKREEGGGGGGAGTFLMEHMVTFRKFRFYHPPTPSATEITKFALKTPTPFF